VGGGLWLNGAEVEGESDLQTKKGESVMTVEKVKSNGAYVLSELVGEGAGEYLFTRTYYGYTLAQAKAQFRIELKEAK
jgi:hypothetical protein